MSVNDMIKKSVLKSFGQYNVPKMALALLVALIVGMWPGYFQRDCGPDLPCNLPDRKSVV